MYCLTRQINEKPIESPKTSKWKWKENQNKAREQKTRFEIQRANEEKNRYKNAYQSK